MQACGGPAGLGDHLIRVVKLVHAIRGRTPWLHAEVDPIVYPLLFAILTRARRVSDLAAVLGNDVSTISRQVSHLAQLGLVERQVDPSDRRAQVLALTPAGENLLRELREQRDRLLDTVIGDWPRDDRAEFSRLLARFADALEASYGILTDPDGDRHPSGAVAADRGLGQSTPR